MSDSADTVTEGRAAWARIRDHGRKNFDDWICVGRALVVGRTVALKAAGTNKPVGSKYNIAMGRWLVDHQLDGVVAKERYALLKIIEHLPAVQAWRDGLPEPQRRRHNHPSLWHVFRRATKAATDTPARQYVGGAKSHRGGHAIHWPGDAIRRAACAIREVYSTDFYVMARRALEAAVRNEADLIELLPPNTVAMSALPRRTDVVSPAGYVG